MTDYKRLQYEEYEEPHIETEAERREASAASAKERFLFYAINRPARKEFEDLVGYQAAFNTYMALLNKIKGDK